MLRLPTLDEVTFGARALATLARVDGAMADAEARWITALARALGAEGLEAASLASIDAEELATAVTDPVARERVIQAMILTSLLDERVTDEETALVRTFAEVLGVGEPRVRSLELLAEGSLRRLWLDLARRSFAREEFEEALREKGVTGLWKIVGPMLGLAKDPELARRYMDLGLLPADTLGYRYFRFVTDNDLGFPGEGIVPESGVWHDLTHVLAGYGVDPEGEVSVVSFIAGYRKQDPFFWLFTIALQFHLGIKVSPYSPGMHGNFRPELVLPAFARGAALVRDLSVDWDYAPLLPRPLEEVRRELGVPPP